MTTQGERWTAWLESARDGDERAFDRLVEDARPVIWRRALGKLQDAALADEVASRTFINVWKAREKFDASKSKATTWIYTIAKRLTIDLVEQRKTQQERMVLGFEAQGQSGEEDNRVHIEPSDPVELAPPDEVELHLVSLLVREAMEQLSENDRQILELFANEQLSYDQIAARLGIGLKAVGPRLTRARQRLKEHLSPEALR